MEGPVSVLSRSAEVSNLQVAHPDRLAYVTQTTLSMDDTLEVIETLKNRFHIQGSDLNNICYASQTQQNSVRRLAKSIDVLLVVGARNSSNSNRLREVGEQSGVLAYLIEDADDLNLDWFSEKTMVGMTAGASAPEETVQKILERLRTYYPCTIREMTSEPEPTQFGSSRSLGL